MGPTWVLSAPGRPHVGLMNLAIWAVIQLNNRNSRFLIVSGRILYHKTASGAYKENADQQLRSQKTPLPRPCVARSSADIMYTVQDERVCLLWWMTSTTYTISVFSNDMKFKHIYMLKEVEIATTFSALVIKKVIKMTVSMLQCSGNLSSGHAYAIS